MKRNLLLVLLIGIIWLPTTHAQLLTEIRDTTTSELQKSRFYLITGTSFRVSQGYSQMKKFYERQGFETPLPLFLHLGGGGNIGERFSVEFLMEAGYDSDDRDFQNGTRSSLEEGSLGLHALLGYRFWQKRHTSLVLQGGVSGLFRSVSITEQRPETFDFNNVNTSDAPVVRNWPYFTHRQGALHLALQLKLSYPRPRWWSTDIDLKIGFVSGLNSKSWSVNPGQGLNVPIDNAQYFYLSSAFHFFSRQRR